MQELDILILGAGWTATFLIPLLQEKRRNFAATTTDGREVAGVKTISYKFDIEAKDAEESLKQLPLAKAVLITFPLTTTEQSKFLMQTYSKTHKRAVTDVHYIQLGSTGIWQIDQKTLWLDRRSPYDTSNARACAEDELLRQGGAVLNLAGLWGGARDPRQWLDRVAKTKEQLKTKKALHMIHGLDVSRAVLAVISSWDKAKAQRWMLTDGFVYDWYALLAGWADASNGDANILDNEPSKQAIWVRELMQEENIFALPRSMETLGRAYSSLEFWETFDLTPLKARI